MIKMILFAARFTSLLFPKFGMSEISGEHSGSNFNSNIGDE